MNWSLKASAEKLKQSRQILKPKEMKKIIALFSKKRSQISIATFSEDVLSVNELVNIRGGGEPYQPDMPILIPPEGAKK